MPVSVIFLINLCIALFCLNLSYIISLFVGDAAESACKAFSFIFHYTFLISCTALAVTAFFTGVIKPFEGKQKLAYIGVFGATWGRCLLSGCG